MCLFTHFNISIYYLCAFFFIISPVNKNLLAEICYFKVTRPSYFVRVPSYFEALWYPHLYFDRKSNI